MLLAAKSGAGKAARAPKPLTRQILQAVVILPFGLKVSTAASP
jgi:hypothetical protein